MPSVQIKGVPEASALATALMDDGPAGTTARRRLQGERLTAPHLVDLEVPSVVRRPRTTGALDVPGRTARSRTSPNCPSSAHPTSHCWRAAGSRGTVTADDASHVALAEALGVVPVTADARLSRAPGPAVRGAGDGPTPRKK
jgi:predicted nucleic acid-binding protein